MPAVAAAISPSPPPVAEATASPTPLPEPSPSPTATERYPITTLEAVPPCAVRDVPTAKPYYSDWASTIVDSTYSVGADYAPPDLVGADEAGLSSYFQVRSIMIPDLQALADAAWAAGAPLAIDSAYRSYDTQVWTFWYWVSELGYETAIQSSARPGHSEHQLGLAIDFKASGGPDPWDYYNFATDSPTGQWLAANAWKYGFLMSYPLGKSAKTCYGFEPWHYRYVGVDEAAAIHASGLTTREWMWQHQPTPEPPGPRPWPSPVLAPYQADSAGDIPAGSPIPARAIPTWP